MLGRITHRAIAEYLQVSVKRIEKLMAAVRRTSVFSDNGGRALKLDSRGVEDLKQSIMRRKDELNPIMKSEMYTEVDKLVETFHLSCEFIPEDVHIYLQRSNISLDFVNIEYYHSIQLISPPRHEQSLETT